MTFWTESGSPTPADRCRTSPSQPSQGRAPTPSFLSPLTRKSREQTRMPPEPNVVDSSGQKPRAAISAQAVTTTAKVGQPWKPTPGEVRPTGEADPDVWTGCCSQVRSWHVAGSRRYVSGLLDRLAGRGLDGDTRALLVSLADRLPGNRLGHQTSSAQFLRSMPLFPIANFVEGGWPQTARTSSRGASKAAPWRSTLQAMRASLLASAAASLLG